MHRRRRVRCSVAVDVVTQLYALTEFRSMSGTETATKQRCLLCPYFFKEASKCQQFLANLNEGGF